MCGNHMVSNQWSHIPRIPAPFLGTYHDEGFTRAGSLWQTQSFLYHYPESRIALTWEMIPHSFLLRRRINIHEYPVGSPPLGEGAIREHFRDDRNGGVAYVCQSSSNNVMTKPCRYCEGGSALILVIVASNFGPTDKASFSAGIASTSLSCPASR